MYSSPETSRHRSIKRVARPPSKGAIAASLIHRYLASEHHQQYLRPSSAAAHDHYGDPDVIRVTESPVPTIADDEDLLVRSRGSPDSNPRTWHLLTETAVFLVAPERSTTPPAYAGPSSDTTLYAAPSSPPDRWFTNSPFGDSVFRVATESFTEVHKGQEAKLMHRTQPATRCRGYRSSPDLQHDHPPRRSTPPAQRRFRSLVIRTSATSAAISSDQQASAWEQQLTGVSARRPDRLRSLARRPNVVTSGTPTRGGPYDAIIDRRGVHAISKLRPKCSRHAHALIVGAERGDTVTGIRPNKLHARILSPLVRQRLTFIVNRERQARPRTAAAASSKTAPSSDGSTPYTHSIKWLKLCGYLLPATHREDSRSPSTTPPHCNPTAAKQSRALSRQQQSPLRRSAFWLTASSRSEGHG